MEDQGGRGRGRGRARGRARGRSRGAEGQGPAAPAEDPQRPGDPGGSGRARGPVSHEPTQQDQPPGQASGRASYRGGVREPRPGLASGEVPRPPVDEMAQLSVGSSEARDVGKRRSDFRYTEPHTRPAHITDKKGNSGNPVQVMTNFFALESNPEWMLYQYHVKFNPEIDSKKMRQGMLYDHRDLIGTVKAFDGNILYIPHKLPQEETDVYSTRRSDDASIRITITLTNELGPNSLQGLQVYNIIFRKVQSEIGMQQIGRHYYNRDQCIDIPRHKLSVMPGFITSILQYETRVMLCADVSHKILRSDTVLDIMYELYNSNSANFHEVCTRRLTGSIVLTRYNNKTYRIDDIEWDKNPSDTFNRRNGEPISYNEYYKTHHSETIKDPNQPLLMSLPKKSDIRAGQTEPFKLIPELCILTGLTDELRSDFNVMKDLGAHTRVPPDGRRDTLMKFLKTMNDNKNVQELMGGWGIRFAQQLHTFNARLLNPEPVAQCQQSLNYRQSEADWSRDMRGKKLQSVVNLVDWAIIYVANHENQAGELVKTLQRVGSPMGFMISGPKQVRLNNDRNESYLNALRETVIPSTQLVLCLLPNNRKDRYDAVKKLTCYEKPVPSQCVVLRTLGKNLMSVATKIAIQLNCKLGGEVWTVEIPVSGIMVIGIDTYHDSSKKGLSVGAVVCSMNKSLTKYYSKVSFQQTHEELLSGLYTSITASLRQYHQINGKPPERVVVYRDGVGDGQLPAVVEHEIKQIHTCFQAIGQDYKPKMAVVVVKKRINARIFTGSGSGLSNPCPGTIVDSEITKPEWYDFFLVSQSVRQGTVTPTHYNVIWDDSGLKPDHIQRLTYKLTHLYYNWPGTIRVPAPCQYAHKLAFLVGQSTHREPHESLSDKLFFL